MTILRSTILALTLVACGGDDDSGSGNIALENLGTTIGTEYCAKAFDCCTAAEIPMFFEGANFTDEAGCLQFYTGFFNAIKPMYDASITAGKLEYSGSNAAGCVSALRAASCTDFVSENDPLDTQCENPFIGKVAANGACNYDEECVSGYCEGDVQFGTPMPGTCKTLPATSQPCTDFECAAGAYCSSSEVCTAQKANGMPCRDGEECTAGACNGSTSTTDGTCGPSAICNGQ